jgi:hypothetical protein
MYHSSKLKNHYTSIGHLPSVICLLFSVFCFLSFAEAPQPDKSLPPGQYDEAKVPQYTLPDPLTMLDGQKVTDVNNWKQKRRPEILKLFEENVYGRTMAGRPKDMTWKVKSENRKAMNGKAIEKTVTIYFTGKKNGPKMDLFITLPADAGKPVPIFLIPAYGRTPQPLLKRGYGQVTFRLGDIEQDRTDGSYDTSIRKFFAKPGQTAPEPNEWGAVGAWAWGMSRAMDYLVTDPDIDKNKVCILGFSRYGKVAMWAAAQDERFAIVFSCQGGCGAATIVRRQFGETIASINSYAPHLFCGNFKTYDNRVNELSVDWHMLIALMAPRPVFIATAEQDLWTDPRGSFLAAKAAEPVYALFGEKGLGVDKMPPVDTPVGDFIAYYNANGVYSMKPNDLNRFLDFADRHFGITKTEKQKENQ